MPPAAPPIDVAARLADVRRRVQSACSHAGRGAQEVTVVAVSKGHAPGAVRAALDAGQVDFGENRAQELRDKAGAVGVGPRWHFVGRLQRNKARDVVELADLVHSVDRVDLAEVLAARALRGGRSLRVLAQVNVGKDPAKGGCSVEETPALVARIEGLEAIECVGLMTVPPLGEDPRPLFSRLRALRDALAADHPRVRELSMGMSADFEAAVAEGATIVRLGEAVFGPRPAANGTSAGRTTRGGGGVPRRRVSGHRRDA